MAKKDDEIVSSDGTVYVPEKKKKNLVLWFLLFVAGVFLAVGLSSLSLIVYLVRDLIMTFLEGLMGWDPIISSIFLGALGLFSATLIYVVALRGSEVAKRIESTLKLDITNEPTEFYATELIPTEELMFEFKKRGCDVYEQDSGGFGIDCKTMPVNQRMKSMTDPDHFTLDNMQKLAIISVISVLWGVFVGMLIMEVIADEHVWIGIVILLVITVVLLLGTKIVSLWQTIIIWCATNIAFSLFSSEDPTVIWSLWGALAIYIILVAIAYLLHRDRCRIADKWYCDLL